ncbi:MAG: LysR family transcriptional regulator [Roseibium sp.]|uniref:LysR family transcriptional regulator n=2 Tax=Roseibium sp. TaxID=1936156 RepID=UPI001B2917E9|nr:LysR family transcriptional regulator [Roseibium sp.]MBO6893363.1 LysR family transcriptional regulator [Roseibium sp.]MBO6932862.1 LysR family transcriptional regulator [Roseibium sp.]
MRQPVTSLPSLNCFRAAARLESFSLAAGELNLTHGAISRAVRLLEEDLGTALFERRNRRVFLTEDGRSLARAVDDGLGRIEQEVMRLQERRKALSVTLSCEPTLLMRWLIPRVPAFKASHPDIDLQLIAGGGPVELGRGTDLAIRRNDFDIPSRYQTYHLFDEEVGPVCRSDRVDTFFHEGALKADAPLLHTRTRPDAWNDWFGATSREAVAGEGQFFEHFYFSLQAAVAGLGVAIGLRRQVTDDLNAGLLAAPLGFAEDGSHYSLLAAEEISDESPKQKVLHWLTGLA